MYLALDIFSASTLGCTKIGALLFFRRIFCTVGRRTLFSYLTLISIIAVALWTMAYDILPLLAWHPHIRALDEPP